MLRRFLTPVCRTSSARRTLPMLALLVSGVAPVLAAQQTLAAPQRRAVVDSVAAFVERAYVDADTGRLIAQHIRARQAAGAYATATTVTALSEAVTRDMRHLNGDLHLGLRHQPELAPRLQRPPAGGVSTAPSGGPMEGPPTDRPRVPGEITPVRDLPPELRDHPRYVEAVQTNFGMRRVEVLPGNVGYLDFESFLGAPGAEYAIEDALRFLERTDAIILDVRENRGGASGMSHLIASHFLPREPRPTVRVQSRLGENEVRTTIADIAGPRRLDIPLYLLVSRASASAAEEFAFLLKNAGRAVLVGERTMGAGHMVEAFDAGHGFVASISITRVSDPATGREFEVVGVEPDISVAPEYARDVAYAAALRRIAQGDAARRPRLERMAAAASLRAEARPIAPEAMAAYVGEYEGGRAFRVREGRLEYRRGARPVWDAVISAGDGRVLTSDGTPVRLIQGPDGKRLEIQALDGSLLTVPALAAR